MSSDLLSSAPFSGTVELREYRLNPDRAAAVVRKQMWVVPVFMSVVAAAIFFLRKGLQRPDASDYFFFAVMAGCAVVSMRRAWAQQTADAKAWRLILDSAEISLQRPRVPEKRLQASDITRIVETTGHALVIHAADPRRRITVPASVEGYPEIRQRLSTWPPGITPAKRVAAVSKKVLSVLAVLPAFGMLVVDYSNNPNVVVPLGSLCIFCCAACTYALLSNPDIDPRVRRLGWLVLWPIASLGYKVYEMLPAWRHR